MSWDAFIGKLTRAVRDIVPTTTSGICSTGNIIGEHRSASKESLLGIVDGHQRVDIWCCKRCQALYYTCEWNE